MKPGSNGQIAAGFGLLILAAAAYGANRVIFNIDFPLLWIGILAALGAVTVTVAVFARLRDAAKNGNGDKPPTRSTALGIAFLVLVVLGGGFLGYRYWTYSQCVERCDEDCEAIRSGFAGGFRGRMCDQQEQVCMRNCTFP